MTLWKLSYASLYSKILLKDSWFSSPILLLIFCIDPSCLDFSRSKGSPIKNEGSKRSPICLNPSPIFPAVHCSSAELRATNGPRVLPATPLPKLPTSSATAPTLLKKFNVCFAFVARLVFLVVSAAVFINFSGSSLASSAQPFGNPPKFSLPQTALASSLDNSSAISIADLVFTFSILFIISSISVVVTLGDLNSKPFCNVLTFNFASSNVF